MYTGLRNTRDLKRKFAVVKNDARREDVQIALVSQALSSLSDSIFRVVRAKYRTTRSPHTFAEGENEIARKVENRPNCDATREMCVKCGYSFPRSPLHLSHRN